ncbi:response regulator [Fodinisporobacter ferrooxydans]|uniref:Transcriptional regulatory protein n=1 Tax=Fodinisporobacter ferrooxydans TaxID=2901836 RepID=A0ABY4CQH0_9BACL|nr:response regulator [Alicyclobacillaceae bacterium MYW30-H2]
MDRTIRVLLIEDDPMVQEVNRQFVENVVGFTVVGIANNGVEGIQKINDLKPDLVLLDVFMPLKDGLDTLAQIREQVEVDVIIITAANDMRTIRWFLQKGAVDYIIKPFKFERIKKSLENYSARKRSLDEGRSVTQAELDQLLHGKHLMEHMNAPKKQMILPKGLNEITLNRILEFLTKQSVSLSAEEVAEGVGIARVTARRYLEYLEENGSVKIDIQYGGVGRPVNRYLIRNE